MIEERVAEALSLLLDERVRPEDDIRMASCDKWDSVKHIEIIMTLEDLFSISFAPAAIPALTSQRSLTAAVQQLLAE